MMTLQLFKVLTSTKGKPKFFDSKLFAKRQRDKEHRQGRRNVHVARGPDHWRGESFQ